MWYPADQQESKRKATPRVGSRVDHKLSLPSRVTISVSLWGCVGSGDVVQTRNSIPGCAPVDSAHRPLGDVRGVYSNKLQISTPVRRRVSTMYGSRVLRPKCTRTSRFRFLWVEEYVRVHNEICWGTQIYTGSSCMLHTQRIHTVWRPSYPTVWIILWRKHIPRCGTFWCGITSVLGGFQVPAHSGFQTKAAQHAVGSHEET